MDEFLDVMSPAELDEMQKRFDAQITAYVEWGFRTSEPVM